MLLLKKRLKIWEAIRKGHLPFSPEVKEHYNNLLDQKQKAAADRKANFAKWESNKPAQAQKLKHFLSGDLPEIPWNNIPQKENPASRDASAAVLSVLADQVENMIVASADLSNSDKTDAFLKKTTAFKHHDFSGAFLQAGVSELTMAALSIGMALHGGVIPACATFFAFSDYMKPAIRVCALMGNARDFYLDA